MTDPSGHFIAVWMLIQKVRREYYLWTLKEIHTDSENSQDIDFLSQNMALRIPGILKKSSLQRPRMTYLFERFKIDQSECSLA